MWKISNSEERERRICKQGTGDSQMKAGVLGLAMSVPVSEDWVLRKKADHPRSLLCDKIHFRMTKKSIEQKCTSIVNLLGLAHQMICWQQKGIVD